MSELTVTQLFADYFDEDALREPAYRLYRVDGGDDRWYYSPEIGRYFPSVTTILDATMPTGYGLIEWMKKHGQESDNMRDERAAYGTWLHMQYGNILANARAAEVDPSIVLFDFFQMEQDIEDTIHALPAAFGASPSKWSLDARKDILAFEAWRREHSVRALAIEVTMCSQELGYAGTVDLICQMNIGSGQNGKFLKKDGRGQRVTAIVDFKSGRKGFYEKHEIQLDMYARMAKENFGIAADRLFNWSPKDWRTAPGWNLKDQTDSASRSKVGHLLNMWEIDGKTSPTDSLRTFGQITVDKSLDECYAFEAIADRFTEKVAA